ncbi:MAG: methyltransferase domain-containing protein [Ignavibacteriae bacterium]|nr:methyltransferase domain-containing protein [Ignavibacteria bacterium]MBI3364677.1 methyltransferase domain-containing protein [Ignavibacteriota bacterium]
MSTFTLREFFAARLNFLPSALYDSFPAVLLGRALVLAHKLGVFEALHDRPRTDRELVSSLNLPLKSLQLLLPPLSASGYLKKYGDSYSLTAQSKKWLVKSAPHYIGNFLAYIELLHGHWMYLEDTLKAGKPPKTYVEMFTEKEWKIYTLGMMDLAGLLIPHVIPQLKLAANASSLLDVCGSHGLYSIELCKRNPNLTATIADFPEVLTTTREIVRKHRLENRIQLLPCDVTRASFNNEQYDAVLAFNIIHGFPVETNRHFIESLAAALRRGGSLYILDQLKDTRSKGVDQLLPLMVGLNLLNEIGGNVYSFSEVKSWCEKAGLNNVQFNRLSVPGVHLVHAEKH